MVPELGMQRNLTKILTRRQIRPCRQTGLSIRSPRIRLRIPRTALILLLMTSLLLSSIAHSEPCLASTPLNQGETTNCKGILVPSLTLRNALICSKKTVPLLRNDLDLCNKSSVALVSACNKKLENINAKLRDHTPKTSWNGIVTAFLVGALATSITVIAIK